MPEETEVLNPQVDEPTPEPPPEPLETPEPTESAAEPQPAEAAPSEPEEPSPEKLDKEIVKALREFRSAKPEYAQTARQITDTMYRAQAYTSVFPTVEDARKAQVQLEALGGVEGIEQMQQAMEALESVDDMARRGDPGLIDSLVEESPEGFAALMRHGMKQLSRVDPSAYAELLLPSIVESGLDESLGLILERLQNGEYDGVTREVNRIVQWFSGQQRNYENIRRQAAATPQAQPGSSGNSRESQLQYELVATQVGSYVEQNIQSQMREFFKGRDAASQGGIVQEAIRRLDETAGVDKAYLLSMNRFLRAGKTNEAVKFARAHIDAMLPKVVREITARYGAQKTTAVAQKRAAVQPAGTRKPAPGGEILNVPAKPPVSSLDMDAPNADLLLMTGMGVRKSDGRTIRWPRT